MVYKDASYSNVSIKVDDGTFVRILRSDGSALVMGNNQLFVIID